ncbi:hypothetical protein M2459_003614 [Parabacteroides sp. PF5-5]|uniref:hypothetical protein n=1 Tax=unclassified Parabacteroides TaxID=2649774 RepID=UPI0024750676|nr:MULTISPECIES: hypothetical protein [unclassified Parabacteroides]MDH6306953.1 hypothetical protein [Parabacteroides sp. PH5-39]MDH6317827.1 hypothetical protein [Parabacteroides sp. PF5-13]MDH6321558.1 hypothetical protein [Parabacteroides sp. PH5-13]MDH6325366.1 hypothetical protein [Parabacteroides sp. PH5-8]MDH6329037.1 hypothetical protein [Parabacteroides sp. PH5-41]
MITGIKKILFALFMAITLMACEGPTGPMGPEGPQGEGMDWIIKTYDVKSRDWVRVGEVDELGSYFYYDFDEPDLSKFIFDSGALIGYYLDGGAWAPMLYSIPVHDGQNIWTETYTYDYTVGSIRFYVNISDFYTKDFPGDMTFRIVMLY